MGLYIHSESSFEYGYSYSGLHYIRWMAHRSIGGTMDFSEFMESQRCENEEYIKTRDKFPNLLWHSDCDGTYTLRGKVEPFDTSGDLLHGNSRGLLEELKFIKEELPKLNDPEISERYWYVFDMFYNVVKDTVENCNGKIAFN